MNATTKDSVLTAVIPHKDNKLFVLNVCLSCFIVHCFIFIRIQEIFMMVFLINKRVFEICQVNFCFFM